MDDTKLGLSNTQQLVEQERKLDEIIQKKAVELLDHQQKVAQEKEAKRQVKIYNAQVHNKVVADRVEASPELKTNISKKIGINNKKELETKQLQTVDPDFVFNQFNRNGELFKMKLKRKLDRM